MSNKLYTEEEIRRFFNEIYMMPQTVDHCIDELTPIELPSDVEIKDEANSYIENDHILFVTNSRNSKRYGFIDGAKWMRDKIQGGNNEQ